MAKAYGRVIDLSKYDECRYKVVVTYDERNIYGIWCPESRVLSLDGHSIGIFGSLDEVTEWLCDTYKTADEAWARYISGKEDLYEEGHKQLFIDGWKARDE